MRITYEAQQPLGTAYYVLHLVHDTIRYYVIRFCVLRVTFYDITLLPYYVLRYYALRLT